MLVIYPFHAGDQMLALQTAHWISELGTVEKHQCLIVHDKNADPEIASKIKEVLAPEFYRVVLMPLREGAPGTKGTNLLFRRVVRQVQASAAGHFLWMNPDAIPLREGWLDAIDAAWKMMPRGKVFLGCHAGPPLPHMSAVGVYPQDAEIQAPNLVMADVNPFNINAAPQMVPKMAHTDLIVESNAPPLSEATTPPNIMPDRAVLWHGSPDCKDGILIHILRELPREARAPLEIIQPKPQENTNRPAEKMSVPENPLKVDRSAQKAASLAGSEGIPSEEIDSNTQIPGIKPPTVSPVKASTAPPIVTAPKRENAVQAAAGITTAAKNISEDVNVNKPPAAEDVDALAQSLARIRDNSPADKANVLAALRNAGFPITGKQAAPKKGARK